jgi:hypothetical protein
MPLIREGDSCDRRVSCKKGLTMSLIGETGWNLWGTLPHFLLQQNQAADDCPEAARRCAAALAWMQF